jgi:hypothetical protein
LPLGLGLRKYERKTPVLPGPLTDYTLPCASELNGRKTFVKDR